MEENFFGPKRSPSENTLAYWAPIISNNENECCRKAISFKAIGSEIHDQIY